MTTAAIYVRVSGRQQKEEQTIGSQIVECHQAAEQWGLDVPAEWAFTDEGYSGASLAASRTVAGPVCPGAGGRGYLLLA
jgi:DNA invertase Pin-like site-specific DNA recombinase